MTSTRPPRIKVCCIGSVDEAMMAVEAGVDAIGLVASMPSGPGVIAENLIRAIATTVPPPIATFLLTSHQRVEDIVAQQRRCATNTIQLCDRLVEGRYEDLRDALPGIAIVQVIHVNGQAAIDEAARIAGDVDALLLDSGNQALPTRELGGTGRTHDWRVSAAIRRASGVPVFLAGGLRPDNVRDAINQVEPWGVDLCGGVRSHGRLDPSKLGAFLLECRRAEVRRLPDSHL